MLNIEINVFKRGGSKEYEVFGGRKVSGVFMKR